LTTAINMDSLFKPSSLAIIGASNDTGKAGGRFLKGFIDTGYQGALFAVNPNGGDIQGVKKFPEHTGSPG